MSQNNKPILIKNSSLMVDLKSSLFTEFNREREGIHISDILICKRETVFRKLKPQALTDRDLNNFTSGRSIHDCIQTIAKFHKKYQVEKEVVFEPAKNEYTKDIEGIPKDFKIMAHIDLFDTVNNIPIEAKTVRKARLGNYNKFTKTWSEEEPKSFNIDQLKYYMALTDASKGYIIYQLLMNFEDYPFKIFEITMSKGERIELLRKMVKDAIEVQKGIDSKDPSIVSHVVGNKELDWKCNYCAYLNECIEMRAK